MGVTADMPYELVLDLSRVYDRQNRYRDFGDAIVQDILTDIRRLGFERVLRDQPASFIQLQEDFSNRETVLLSSYDSTLTRLDRARR